MATHPGESQQQSVRLQLDAEVESGVSAGTVCEFLCGFLESLPGVLLFGVAVQRSPERVVFVGHVVSVSVVLDGLGGVIPSRTLVPVVRVCAERREVGGRVVVVGGDELLDVHVDDVADGVHCGEVVVVLVGKRVVDGPLVSGDVEASVGFRELAVQVLDSVGDVQSLGSTTARVMAQPGVALHHQFELDEDNASPVEEAILDSIDTSRYT